MGDSAGIASLRSAEFGMLHTIAISRTTAMTAL